MTFRRGRALGLTLVGLLVPSVAHAQDDRQSVRAQLTTTQPGASTGMRIEMRFSDPANPGGKPHSVDKVVIESPRGTRFDHSALPRCTATDAELMARGEAACPAGSKVQSGRILLDTGSPLGLPRLIRFRTTTFNADGGFVSLGEAENFVFRGVVRSQTDGNTTVVDYADAPGYGGPDMYSAMRTMLTSGPALERNGRPFLRTPRSCPPSGRWTTRFTFIYHDGVRQTERTSSPCEPRRPPSPAGSPPELSRQALSMRFTNGAPGASTGTEVRIRFRNPSHPDGKPIPVRRETFIFPRGTRFDPAVVPVCAASPAELMLLGESACPPETRVGGGTATAISGSPFDPVDIDIDAFDNGTGLALLSTVRRIGIRFVAHAVREGRTLSVEYPRSPGGPPDGETALRAVNNLFDARGSGSRAYVRTPRRCPATGRWTFVGRFTYADGVTQTAKSTQSCRNGGPR